MASSAPRTRSIWDHFGDQRNVDPFRLSIVGFASIEDQITEALAEAFGGELPDEIRRTPFKACLALARAMNLIPELLRDPLGRLEALRNDFAHGKIDELDEARGKDLLTALAGMIPEKTVEWRAILGNVEPEIVLTSLMVVVQEFLTIGFDEARQTRTEVEATMNERWQKEVADQAGEELEAACTRRGRVRRR